MEAARDFIASYGPAFRDNAIEAIKAHPKITTAITGVTTVAAAIFTAYYYEVRAMVKVLCVTAIVGNALHQNYGTIFEQLTDVYHLCMHSLRHRTDSETMEGFTQKCLNFDPFTRTENLNELIVAFRDLRTSYDKLGWVTHETFSIASLRMRSREDTFRRLAKEVDDEVRKGDLEIDRRYQAMLKKRVFEESEKDAEPGEDFEVWLGVYLSVNSLSIRPSIDDGNCLFDSCLGQNDSKTPEQVRAEYYDFLMQDKEQYKQEFVYFITSELVDYHQADAHTRETILAKIPESFRQRYRDYADDQNSVSGWLQNAAFDAYIEAMRGTKHYPAMWEMRPLAEHLQRPICLVMQIANPQKFNESSAGEEIIILYNHNRKHFDRLISLS